MEYVEYVDYVECKSKAADVTACMMASCNAVG